MKLIIDIDDDSIAECAAYDLIPQYADKVEIHGTFCTLKGNVDGWKHDGRTSKRLCASAKNARADR